MAKINATEYAEKWARRIKGSTEDVRRGVARTTEAPGMAAARQVDLMKQKLLASIEDGTWAKNVSKVTLQEWQEKMTEKGIPRLAQGVDAAQASQVQMAEKLLADVDASVAVVDQTPRGDLEQNIQRMTTFAREMHKRKKRS